jgi:hypothetical protein
MAKGKIPPQFAENAAKMKAKAGSGAMPPALAKHAAAAKKHTDAAAKHTAAAAKHMDCLK